MRVPTLLHYSADSSRRLGSRLAWFPALLLVFAALVAVNANVPASAQESQAASAQESQAVDPQEPQTVETQESNPAAQAAQTTKGGDASVEDQLLTMKTVAEFSGFEKTADEKQVAVFMRQLANHWSAAELITLGRSIEGRPIWALVVEPDVDEAVPQTQSPLTVLLLGGIHSGECDGKEALLALARDMAGGKQAEWWKSLRLIFVPNFNVDGNERRGADHRPGQAGPAAGMGTRENAQGLDLNRDFIKLETPEVRSLVTALNEYDVDVLIDTHTTNGSLHQYHLTYDIPHTPTLPKPIDQWLRGKLLPRVTQRLESQGIPTFYYGNFSQDHRRWSTYGHQPRYSTEYMGLRGKIGILSESYSYASYEERFEASYHFVTEVLRGLVEDQSAVRTWIDEAAASDKAGRELSIQGAIAKTADSIVAKGFVTPDGKLPSPPYNHDSLSNHEKKDYPVQLWNRGESTKAVDLPKYYVVSNQNAWAIGRLRMHGVQLNVLQQDVELPYSYYRVESVDSSPEFQGHEMRRTSVSLKQENGVLEAGSFVVATDQPLGVLASYLLEPESDDSLATWNFFDPDVTAGAEFPVQRVNGSMPEGVLQSIDSVPATERLTLEHIFAPKRSVDYDGDSIRGANWLKGTSEYVLKSRSGRTYAVDAATGAQRRLSEMDSFRSKLADLDAFTRQEAEKAATIESFTEDWSHALVSHKKDLYFFDAEADTVRQLTHSSDEMEQLAELSPTGDHVAFVRGNNLWVVDSNTTELKQLTDDGSEEVLNGILDWVYQEELYGRGNFKGFWWSPDGKQIAYLRLDQTPVPHYQVSDSISYAQSLESTRYPKAGQPLPTVDVWIVDLASGERRKANLEAWGANDRLVGRVTWSPVGELWLQVFNRVQNKQDLVLVDTRSGSTEILFSEASPGWIEIRTTPRFLPSGDFLWLSDLPDGRTHLYRVSRETGQRSQLTSGPWDVAELVSVSADHQTCFVTGNISHPIEQQLVAVSLESGAVRQVTSAPGTHRVKVNASGEYFIDTFSSTLSPPIATLHSIEGDLIRAVEAPTVDRHQYLDIAPPKTFTITARDGLELQSQLMLPSGFDVDDPKVSKLPVIVHVYGGPQSPTVRNTWAGRNYCWHQWMCQEGFAILLCDNRSARGRGVKDTWSIRGDMCRIELLDLEDAVAWLKQQSWVDADRIGLWGWSYGGYFTAYAMTHSDLFHCGIAGAPVTDWRNYDAIYTERYMDLPQVNEQGYASSSVVEAAEQLQGRLLIIHGERDDNVHMSNTLQLAYALQKAGKPFELMIYPKNRHGIVDPEQRLHLHTLMADFFKRHLIPNSETPATLK